MTHPSPERLGFNLTAAIAGFLLLAFALVLLTAPAHAHNPPPPPPTNYSNATAGATSSSSAAQTQSATGGNGGTGGSVHQEQAAASAIAPSNFPTVPCFRPASAALSFKDFGVGGGRGNLDPDCVRHENDRAKRETAQLLAALGRPDLALRLACATTDAKETLGVACTTPAPVEAPKEIAAPSVTRAPPAAPVACPLAKDCTDEFKRLQTK